MALHGALLQPLEMPCPYIEGLQSLNENIFVVSLGEDDHEDLLNFGYRHFGPVFFRPMCKNCRSCISIRIPVQEFIRTPSVKRLYNRAKALTITLEKPVPSEDLFRLYLKHKKRFKSNPVTESEETYENYLQSFYFPFPFNRVLVIRDGERIVGISHLDVTSNAISAIYCYYDEDYGRYSPGKLAIYKEIEIAREMGISWLYLGYYVRRNRHSRYKIDYKPNQLMTDGFQWVDYKDAEGKVVNPSLESFISRCEPKVNSVDDNAEPE